MASRGRARNRGRNPATQWMVLAVAFVLGLTLALPSARTLFLFAELDLRGIAIAAIAGAAPVIVVARVGHADVWRSLRLRRSAAVRS
jgi:hypothetical protein